MVRPEELGPWCWAARHRLPAVRLDLEALEAFAATLRAAPPPLPKWDHPAWPVEAGPALDAVVVLGNALNFSYWVPDGEAMWGWPAATARFVQKADSERVLSSDLARSESILSDAFALFGRLTAALAAGVDLGDARVLQSSEITTLFDGGTGTQPLIPERIAFLQSIGRVLEARFGGHLRHALAVPDALDFATHLATVWPTAYEDAPLLEGQPVPLRKRAQLAAGMLHAARIAREVPGLERPERLTLYADYMLPRVLRALGILVLAPGLAATIDRGDEVPPDSPEEVALRIATVAAGEGLVQATGIPAIALDYALWRAGFGITARHHRTRTTAY